MAANFDMPDAPSSSLSAAHRRKSCSFTDDSDQTTIDGRDQTRPERNGVTYTYKPVTRVIQACGNCRRKKSRCNGQRPKCKTCSRLGHECIYPSIDPRQRVDEEPVAHTAASNVGSNAASQPPPHNESQLPSQEMLIGKFSQLEARMSEMHSTIMR